MVETPIPRSTVERQIKNIETHPDSDEAYTVERIEDALDKIQDIVLDDWRDYQDDVVYEDNEVLVMQDMSGHLWGILMSDAGIDPDDDAGIMGDIIRLSHKAYAKSLTGDTYDHSEVVVWAKSDEWQRGEKHVIDEIAARTRDTGSVARAVDQYVVETQSMNKASWARRTDRNRSSVTRTTSDE